MNFWNQKNLSAPPTNTYKSKTHDLDLTKFRNAVQEGVNHFKNDDFLVREAALLSRILYRMKTKFRSAKEFKSLEKIKHALDIYLNINMEQLFKNILDITPSRYKADAYLPTRNMLTYILVRIQGLVKLMERIYDTCLLSAYEINRRISIGHFWKIYLILFSLVSRIFILVKYNTKILCELYGKLHFHSKKLENPGRNWLPDNYKLPADLREWLDVKWVYEEEYIDLTFEPTMKIMDFFNLVDDEDDDVQFCDEYVLIDEEDKDIENDLKNLKPVKETLTNRMRGFSINEDDIGEELADVITVNDTIVENISSKDQNYLMNNEDFGEEISDIESISDESYNVNNNTVIDLLEDSTIKSKPEVVVIPDTPQSSKTSNDINLDDIQDYLMSLKELNTVKKKSPKKKKKKIKTIIDKHINLIEEENKGTLVKANKSTSELIKISTPQKVKKKKSQKMKDENCEKFKSPKNEKENEVYLNLISKNIGFEENILDNSDSITYKNKKKTKNKDKTVLIKGYTVKNKPDSLKKSKKNKNFDFCKNVNKRKLDDSSNGTPTKKQKKKKKGNI